MHVSILVDLYPPYRIKALTHMNAHTNAHVHTTTHMHMQHTNMHVHLCTQHHTRTTMHVHAGWIQSSVCCKPEESWHDCGDAPSGWGYSGPARQGARLLFVHLAVTCVVPCALFIVHLVPHNSQRNTYECQKTGNCCCCALKNQIICALEACTFRAWSGDMFFPKIWTENASLGSKLQWIF